jgi:uncharacterized protein
MLTNVLLQSWLVLGLMAPYLLFGFAVAGILSVLVSAQWTERHLGGRGLRPVIKAALWGIPLPLCSCSVIPVVASLRRHGASRAAATAFMLSTPQTGIDSIFVTYALLGPVFAIFRPIAALASGILGGILVLLFGERNSPATGRPDTAPCTEPCCTGDRSQNVVWRALRYGFITLPQDVAWALLAGVLIAGAISALVPEHRFDAYLGSGLGSIVILMAMGIPVYVCATASVPIAVGLIHMGASPGAALAFLIVGPATNPAAFTTVLKMLGRRSAVLYMITVVLSAAGCGLAVDYLLPAIHVAPLAGGPHSHGAEGAGWLANFWAAVLLAVLLVPGLASLYSRWREPRRPHACCSHSITDHGHAGR